MIQEARPLTPEEAVGTKLGEQPRSFPGLTPLSHRLANLVSESSNLERAAGAKEGSKAEGETLSSKLSALSSEVADLEKEAWELKNIRATLMLNFGVRSSYNHYGVGVTESLSTSQMLMEVLNYLTAGMRSEKGQEKGQEKK